MISFGKLTVIADAGSPRMGDCRHRRAVFVRCDCGNESIVLRENLKSGRTKSCGCEKLFQNGHLYCGRPKHGQARGHRGGACTYRSWQAMRQRCSNPNRPRWENYGGRGIKVCERWQGKHGFENFLADMGERPPGTTIGRFGDEGNYEPGNCKWMTPKEQAANRRAA